MMVMSDVLPRSDSLPGTSPRITCRIVDTLTGLEALTPAWDELLDDSSRPEVMLGPAWLVTWWKVYGAGRQLAVGAFYHDDRLVGLAPMCRRSFRYRPGIRFRRLEWLGSDSDEGDGVASDHMHLIVRRGFEQPACDAFVAAMNRHRFGSWDEWVLAAVDSDHPLTPILEQAWRREGRSMTVASASTAPYWTMPGSWDEYVKSLPKKRRHALVHVLRDFEAWAEGTAELFQTTDVASRERGMEILRKLHRERWQAEGGTGVFESPRFVAFHEAFSKHLLERGQLALQWLCVRGEPVAVHYSFRLGDRLSFYQTGRRMDVPGRLSLGTAMLIYLAKDAIAHGVKELDFLAGAAQYKRLFSRTERSLVELRVARWTVREGVRRAARWIVNTMRPTRQSRSAPRADQGDDAAAPIAPALNDETMR